MAESQSGRKLLHPVHPTTLCSRRLEGFDRVRSVRRAVPPIRRRHRASDAGHLRWRAEPGWRAPASAPLRRALSLRQALGSTSLTARPCIPPLPLESAIKHVISIPVNLLSGPFQDLAGTLARSAEVPTLIFS